MNFRKLWLNLRLMGFRGNRPEFYRSLAAAYEAKEALGNFLRAEFQIASAQATRNDSAALAYSIMRRQHAQADTTKLSQLLKIVMPQSDQLMLTALDDVAPRDAPGLLRKIADNIEDQKKLISIIRQAIMVPLMLLPGIFALAYVISTQGIPIVVQVAPKEVWTPFNSAVRTLAEFVAQYGIWVLVMGVVAVSVFINRLPNWTGQTRHKFEAVKPERAMLLFPLAPWILPLVIYRDVQAGLALSSLSVMLTAKRGLKDAIEEIRRAGSPWMRWQIQRIQRHIEKHPDEFQQAFGLGLLSPQLLAKLSSKIRNNPDFGQVLIEVGSNNVEIRERVQRNVSIVNFMILAVGAGLMVFLFVGQLNIGDTMANEMTPQKMKARQLRTLN